jgi:hypothetical protein
MAQSLTHDDLLSVGLNPKRKEPEVVDDSYLGTVACDFETYAWDGSTKIGFSVFDDTKDTDNRIEKVRQRVPGTPRPTALAGADEAYLGFGKKSVWICARRGHLVFTITVPPSPQAEAQVTTLADILLERVAS